MDNKHQLSLNPGCAEPLLLGYGPMASASASGYSSERGNAHGGKEIVVYSMDKPYTDIGNFK